MEKVKETHTVQRVNKARTLNGIAGIERNINRYAGEEISMHICGVYIEDISFSGRSFARRLSRFRKITASISRSGDLDFARSPSHGSNIAISQKLHKCRQGASITNYKLGCKNPVRDDMPVAIIHSLKGIVNSI
jgi:hypothetical protein